MHPIKPLYMPSGSNSNDQTQAAVPLATQLRDNSGLLV